MLILSAYNGLVKQAYLIQGFWHPCEKDIGIYRLPAFVQKELEGHGVPIPTVLSLVVLNMPAKFLPPHTDALLYLLTNEFVIL
jgi:hypothetical protein